MLCFYKHNFGSHHFDQTENKTGVSGFFSQNTLNFEI